MVQWVLRCYCQATCSKWTRCFNSLSWGSEIPEARTMHTESRATSPEQDRLFCSLKVYALLPGVICPRVRYAMPIITLYIHKRCMISISTKMLSKWSQGQSTHKKSKAICKWNLRVLRKIYSVEKGLGKKNTIAFLETVSGTWGV